jgi:hypothetical protein
LECVCGDGGRLADELSAKNFQQMKTAKERKAKRFFSKAIVKRNAAERKTK